MVVAEVCAGVTEKDRSGIEELIEALRFYPIDKRIAKIAGQYISDFS